MNETMLRNNVLEMLVGGAAHIGFEQAVDGFPAERAGERVKPLEHTMWMLVEHLRLVNRDLIDWVIAEKYLEKPYPSGYWPSPEPPSREAWDQAISSAKADLEIMKDWSENPEFDFSAALERRETHSAFREILLAIAHNAYHIGQMVDLRAMMGVPVKDW
jgi:hypothetical protein